MPYKVLVVDDNADYALAMSRILRHASFEVVTAGTPKAARAEIRKHVPDLVILDLSMPEENGVEFCERLKRARRTRHLPVMLVSAHLEMATFLRESPYAPDAALPKPFDVTELVRTAKALVAAREHRPKEIER